MFQVDLNFCGLLRRPKTATSRGIKVLIYVIMGARIEEIDKFSTS